MKEKINDKDIRINNLIFEKNKLTSISNIYFIIIEIIIILLILFKIFNKIKNSLLIHTKNKEYKKKEENEKNKKIKGTPIIEIEMKNKAQENNI